MSLDRPSPASLLAAALLVPALAAAQERPFCTSGACIPDSLSIEWTESGTFELVLDEPRPGATLSTRVVANVVTSGVQGWSYAVRHDASHLTLLEDSVTTAGTIADPAHPDTVVVRPNFDVTRAVDGGFISTYARDNPDREDIAESYLPYLALRHRADRISGALAATIQATIPNRMRSFDALDLDLYPIRPEVARGVAYLPALFRSGGSR